MRLTGVVVVVVIQQPGRGLIIDHDDFVCFVAIDFRQPYLANVPP